MPTEGFYSCELMDYDSEVSNHRFAVTVLTAANWAAQATLRGDYEVALAGIMAGTRVRSKYGNRVVESGDPSDDPNAQRELKMIIFYHDGTTAEKLSVEIPTPDLSNLDPDDHAHFNIGDGDVIDDLVSAFEAFVLSHNLNAVVVDEIGLVGRRL